MLDFIRYQHNSRNAFYGQYSLDTQDGVSYASCQEKKTLINSNNLFYPFQGEPYLKLDIDI